MIVDSNRKDLSKIVLLFILAIGCTQIYKDLIFA